MSPLVLVRYGELALKSAPVRREFERTLQRNIVAQFASERMPCRIRSDQGHLYVEVDDAARASKILRRVFGITSFSVVLEVATDRAVISAAAIGLADPLLSEGASFAVRARRTGQHAFTSQELARDVGSDIFERFRDRRLRVDLGHPDVEVHVEVRDNRTYLSTTREQGPGGLPLGVAGHIVAYVDGVRGALGAYLLMKRGCRCALVPAGAGGELVEGVLRRFDPSANVAPAVEPGPSADAAIATLADSFHADGVVLPLGIEAYPEAKSRWGDRVVFSPTVGFTDEEVDRRWHAVAQLAS